MVLQFSPKEGRSALLVEACKTLEVLGVVYTRKVCIYSTALRKGMMMTSAISPILFLLASVLGSLSDYVILSPTPVPV